MSAPAASSGPAAAAAAARDAPPAAAGLPSTPPVQMTPILPSVQALTIESHPTLPLVLIAMTTGRAVVHNWRTNTTLGQVKLESAFVTRPSYLEACRWFRPTADRPTVNQFVATFSEGDTFVCTVNSKDVEAAGWTIDARRLQAVVPHLNRIAINSTNSLLCAAGGGRARLVDPESGDEVLEFEGDFQAAQFAPDNPYTLLAFEELNEEKRCLKYDLRSPACRQGRVSTSRPPKEWIVSDWESNSHLLFAQNAVRSVAFSPDARVISLLQQDGSVCVRSMAADGRMLLELPPGADQEEHDECAFTSDGSHLLTWHQNGGSVCLISMADGSIRWSVQLPNWTEDEMHLHEVRPCPGQSDRFLCVIRTAGEDIKFDAFDVQVQLPPAAPSAGLPARPLAAAAGPAAGAAAASGSSPSAAAVPSSVVDLRSVPSTSLLPTASTPLAPASSLHAQVSLLQRQMAHLRRQLAIEQLAARHTADQLALRDKIIADMQIENETTIINGPPMAAAAVTAAAAAAASSSGSPLQPGQIVVKRESVLDLHEQAAVAQRQKRKAEAETQEERDERIRQAQQHREELERRFAEHKAALEARAAEQKATEDRMALQEKELENERLKTTCCICQDRSVEWVYEPCGHAACCIECDLQLLVGEDEEEDDLRRCPLCRATIEGQVQVVSLRR